MDDVLPARKFIAEDILSLLFETIRKLMSFLCFLVVVVDVGRPGRLGNATGLLQQRPVRGLIGQGVLYRNFCEF